MAVSLGYTIFYVPDVGEALAFYNNAFGLATKLASPEGDYGELETGDTTLSFVSHELAHANLDDADGFTHLDPSAAPVGASITLVADDLDAAMATALAAGATCYVEPVRKPWGQTVTYLRDPNGVLIELATPVG